MSTSSAEVKDVQHAICLFCTQGEDYVAQAEAANAASELQDGRISELRRAAFGGNAICAEATRAAVTCPLAVLGLTPRGDCRAEIETVTRVKLQ